MLSVVLFSYNLLIYTVDILIDQSPIPPLTLNAKYLLFFLLSICLVIAGIHLCNACWFVCVLQTSFSTCSSFNSKPDCEEPFDEPGALSEGWDAKDTGFNG